MTELVKQHKALDVAVGIIINSDNRILITKRRDDVHLAGLWEFPGGKCDEGESDLVALQRELREEIGIEVDDAESFCSLCHRYDEKVINLHFFFVKQYRGEPYGREQQPFKWVTIEALSDYEFPPANQVIIKRLQKRVASFG